MATNEDSRPRGSRWMGRRSKAASASGRRRLSVVARIAIAHLARHAAGRLRARHPRAFGWLPESRLSGPERLRVALEELGGSFIKLGQMLALQPDLVSLEYCH